MKVKKVIKDIVAPFKEGTEHYKHFLRWHGIDKPIDSQKPKVYGFFSKYNSFDDVRQQIKAPIIGTIATFYIAIRHAVDCLVGILSAVVHFAFLFDLPKTGSCLGEAASNFASATSSAVYGALSVIAATVALVTRTLTSILVGLYSLPGALYNGVTGKKKDKREDRLEDRREEKKREEDGKCFTCFGGKKKGQKQRDGDNEFEFEEGAERGRGAQLR